MIGEDFMYGSTWLSEWSMKMYDPENEQAFVTRNIDKSAITSQRAKPNHFGATYSEALVLDFLILKDEDDCETQSDFRLTGDEIHYLRGWLESPKKPTELVIPLEEDDMTVHYFGLFTSVQPFIHCGDCYGLYLQFTCNSPYGYSDEQVGVYTVSSGSASTRGKYVNLSAEQKEYLKPIVTITSSSVFGDGETLDICNVSDNENTMSITLPSGKSKVVIDCDKRIVTDGSGNLIAMSDIGITVPISSEYNFVSADSFLFYWLSLVPNENTLTFTPSDGNTIQNIQISARYILKAGGF